MQQKCKNDALIDDISSLNAKTPDTFFEWILKLETVAEIYYCNTRDLTLGKTEEAVFKILKSLPINMSWNTVKRQVVQAVLKHSYIHVHCHMPHQ